MEKSLCENMNIIECSLKKSNCQGTIVNCETEMYKGKVCCIGCFIKEMFHESYLEKNNRVTVLFKKADKSDCFKTTQELKKELVCIFNDYFSYINSWKLAKDIIWSGKFYERIFLSISIVARLSRQNF